MVTTSPLWTIWGWSSASSLVDATSKEASGLPSSRGNQWARSSERKVSSSRSSNAWASSASANIGARANRGSSSTSATPAASHSALAWWGSMVQVWMKRESLVANSIP